MTVESELKTLQARLIGNAGKLFSSTTIASLIGVVSFVIVTRTLGPEQFGALVLVYTFGAAMTRLCGFQTWEMVIRFAAEENAGSGDTARISAVFRFGWLLDVISAAVAATLTVLLARVAGWVFNWSVLVESSVYWYALAVLATVAGGPTAALRYFNRFDLVSWHRISAALVRLVIMVCVVWVAPTFEGFLAGWIVAHILGHLILVVFGVYVQRANSLRFTESAPLKAVVNRDVWRFLGASKLNNVVRVVRELDAQIVAAVIDESAAGLLRVARQLAAIVVRFVDAFFEAIYPDLADLAAGNRNDLFRALVRRASLQVGLLTLLPLAGFIVAGAWFIDIAFGVAYSDAYLTTCVLLAGLVAWGFAQPLAPGLMSLGAPGKLFVVNLLATSVYLLLLLYLVPGWSHVGAGMAMAGLHVTWGLVAVYMYRTVLRQRIAAP